MTQSWHTFINGPKAKAKGSHIFHIPHFARFIPLTLIESKLSKTESESLMAPTPAPATAYYLINAVIGF